MKRFLFVLFILLLVGQAAAVDVHIFYGKGCPHCAKAMAYLESQDVTVHAYEVYFDQQDRALFEQVAAAHKVTITGVPTIFVGDQILVGFDEAQLQAAIETCATIDCPDPLALVSAPKNSEVTQLTIAAVVAAAAVDAINPCAFAVLIILITTVLATKDRRRALWAGIAFSVSIFISYFLMGVGLYSAIGASGIGSTFFIVVAILAIIIGLFNLKDYFAYGKWFVMEVPMSWRPRLKGLIRSVTSVPGAFLIGFAVSLFLLPCTSGPYIVILGLLSHAVHRQYALSLLLLYNLIFVLPMLVITLAIHGGITTTEKAEAWRTGKLKVLHLIAGIILLLLGIGMLVAVSLGLM